MGDEEADGRAQFSGGALMFVAGVLMPAMGIMLEWMLKSLCNCFHRDLFFPTNWHSFTCIAGILGAGYMQIHLLSREYFTTKQSHNLPAMVVGGGVSFAVGLYYSAAFIPVVPQMVFAVRLFGLGVFAAAPFWYLIGSILLMSALKQLWSDLDWPKREFDRRAIAGFMVGLVWMASLDGHGVLAHVLVKGARGSGVVQTASIAILQKADMRNNLLAGCYVDTLPGVWIFWETGGSDSYREDSELAAYRQLFLRVYGQGFWTFPRPAWYRVGLGVIEIR
jgi:hypothetical protein